MISSNILCQSLNPLETINYIKNAYDKYKLNSFCCGSSFYDRNIKIDIGKDGYITITSERKSESYIGKGSGIYKHSYSFYYNNIEVDIVGNNTIRFKCKNNLEECIQDEYGSVNTNRDIRMYFSQQGISKLKNAFIYLFETLKNNVAFNFIDEDPFSPNNFRREVSSLNHLTEESINISKINGVYGLNAIFVGVSKYSILDSGASDVSLSIELETELISKKLIKKEDYIEPALYKIADGSIISTRRLILPNITIGGFLVRNVICSINPTDDIILIGQSVLNRFNSWKIDNERNLLILHK